MPLDDRAQKAVDVMDEHEHDPMVVSRLTKAMKAQAAAMGRDEARYLVDTYYQMQDDRKRAANQVRASEQGADASPLELVGWLAGHTAAIEHRIESLLKAWSEAHPVGAWAMSIKGVGPIISAGLLAYIDIRKAPTVGHIWRFAGLDPTLEWLGRERAMAAIEQALGRKSGELLPGDIEAVCAVTGRKAANVRAMMQYPDAGGNIPPQTVARLVATLARKPWNGSLKTLCWKAGECFVKVSGYDDDVYGHYYLERKAIETEANEAGEYAAQAAQCAERVGRNTDAYKAYSQGKLPPAHIHSRAKRWAVKLFLAHWHWVAYECEHGAPPPKPYIIETDPRHTHIVKPPNWPMPH